MKELTFYLNSVSKKRLFKPIREKRDVIIVLLESIRIITYGLAIPPEKSCGKLVLHVGKISRLTCISEKKYFSINFPFFLDNSDGCVIYDKNDFLIDSRTISLLMELILNKNIFGDYDLLSFFDVLDNIYEEVNIWKCLFDLLTFEDGYIRFDNDIDHVAENHPQYHIDLFYEEHNKIKFGLCDIFNDDSFYNLLVRDDFYFLRKSELNQESLNA